MDLMGAEITQEDLLAFHAAHFSSTPVSHFIETFFGDDNDVNNDHEAFEEDDGLGYYSDGVKRTVTDEQIAIFRHSEIQALLRERRRDEEPDVVIPKRMSAGPELQEGEYEKGVLHAVRPVAKDAPMSKPSIPNQMGSKVSKKYKKKQQSWFKQNVKPDLRKRTWDKVETGLENLDYDEGDTGNAGPPSLMAQRRRVAYDDA